MTTSLHEDVTLTLAAAAGDAISVSEEWIN